MNIQRLRYPVLIVVLWAAGFTGQAMGNTYEVPKLKAFLPMSCNVPPTEAMPLDGFYMIAGMDKRIRIEKGRSYAVDSWMVMMVLEVRPNMVLTKDIVPTAPGQYTGYNLTFRKEETFQVAPAGSVETKVGGASFTLIPLQLDNQAWFDQEMVAAGFEPIPNAPVKRIEGDYQPATPPQP
jgi:hypothetical protein